MTDTLTCGDCDFSRGTKNSVMLQCHLDRKTGEFVRKTQGYVSKDNKACDSFLPDGISRPDPASPLVVLIRARKNRVFRKYATKEDVPWQFRYYNNLSPIVGMTELLYQHKGQSLIQLEAEDARTSIFNIEYYNALSIVHSDCKLFLGIDKNKDKSYLLVGINGDKFVFLAPMVTKDVERKEMKPKTEPEEPSDVQSSLETFNI